MVMRSFINEEIKGLRNSFVNRLGIMRPGGYFAENQTYITNFQSSTNNNCDSSSHSFRKSTCKQCNSSVASVCTLIGHLEGIDILSTLGDTLLSPNTKYLIPLLNCYRCNS